MAHTDPHASRSAALRPGWARRTRPACALLTLALLAARPLISESFQRLELPFLTQEVLAGGPGPAASAWLDLALLIGVLLIGLTSLPRGAPVAHRHRGAAPRAAVAGLVLLSAGVLVSTIAAADRRDAANAGADLLIVALAGMALAVSLDRAWLRRVALAAVLASAGANAVKCWTQRSYEFADALEYWQQHKARLAAAGADLDDPQLINYERRLRSGNTFGYLSHPNVTASILVMALLAAAGLTAGAIRARHATPAVLASLLCLLLGSALWTTGSRGGMASALAGVVLMIGLGVARTRAGVRPGAALAALASLYLAVALATAAWGLTRGTLPHTSLAFRWQYWSAAVQAWTEHPLTGIGRENFAAAYLRLKSPQSTEDVSSPHSLWLGLLVETGPLGLLGAVTLLGCALHRALSSLAGEELGHQEQPRRALGPAQPGRLSPPADRVTGPQWTGWRAPAENLALAAVGGVTLGLTAACTQVPLSTPGVALLWALEPAAVWLLVLWSSNAALRSLATDGNAVPRTGQQAAHEPTGAPTDGRDPHRSAALGWVAAGLTAALLAALIHGAIEFALLTPAGLSVFVMLAAACPARSALGSASDAEMTMEPGAAGPTAPRAVPRASGLQTHTAPLLLPVLLAALVVAHGLLIVRPVVRSQRALDRLAAGIAAARDPLAALQALEWGRLAASSDPWSLAAARAWSRAALAVAASVDDPRARLAALSQAEQAARRVLERRDPDATAYRVLARAAQLRGQWARDAGDEASRREQLRRCGEWWNQAVRASPTDPRLRIEAGHAWLAVRRLTGDGYAAEQARHHLREALAIDAMRPSTDVQRLRESERRQVAEALEELERPVTGPPG